MGKKYSFAKARAMRDQDSALWTAEDMLEDLLEQIRAGVIKPKQIAIHWFADTDDERIGVHDFLVSKCTLPEHMLLLEIGKEKMMDILRE